MSETKKRSRSQRASSAKPFHHNPVRICITSRCLRLCLTGTQKPLVYTMTCHELRCVLTYTHVCPWQSLRRLLCPESETRLPRIAVCLKSTHKRQRSRNQMHKCFLQLPDAYIYPELEELVTIIACRRAPFACDGHKARSRDPHSLGADRGDCMELFRGNLHKIQCSKSDITQLTFQLPDEAFGLKWKTLSTHLRKPADRTPVWRGGFLLV